MSFEKYKKDKLDKFEEKIKSTNINSNGKVVLCAQKMLLSKTREE